MGIWSWKFWESSGVSGGVCHAQHYLYAWVHLKVTIESNVRTAQMSTMGTVKLACKFGHFYYYLPFYMGLTYLPQMSLLLHVSPSSSILCALFKLHRVYSSMGNVGLDAVFKLFHWPTMLSLSLTEFTIEKLLGDSAIVHLGDRPHPSELIFHDHGFNIGGIQDFKVCDLILSFDAQDKA